MNEMGPESAEPVKFVNFAWALRPDGRTPEALAAAGMGLSAARSLQPPTASACRRASAA